MLHWIFGLAEYLDIEQPNNEWKIYSRLLEKIFSEFAEENPNELKKCQIELGKLKN